MGLASVSKLVLFFCLAVFLFSEPTQAHIHVDTTMKLMSDALEWPTTMALIDAFEDDGESSSSDDSSSDISGRRSLFWRRMRYYISYGALAANRIPCPPRSGRPYYTHNCYKARGPVNPYTRGCSAITRCRR